MKILGIIGVIVGAVWALIAFNLDTSIDTAYGRVNNLGLMADRQQHLMLSIAVLAISVLLFLFGKRSVNTDQSESFQNSSTRACPFCAELIKIEAIKCKHCGSDVPPLVVETPALGSFFEKPDGMSIGEYQEHIIERYKVARQANGYKWRDRSYYSFQDLISAIKSAS